MVLYPENASRLFLPEKIMETERINAKDIKDDFKYPHDYFPAHLKRNGSMSPKLVLILLVLMLTATMWSCDAGKEPGDSPNGRQLPQATDADQNSFERLYKQARLQESQSRYAEAIQTFIACLDLQPEAYSVWLDLGKCHLRIGQFAEAEAVFQQAVTLKSEIAEGFYLWG